VGHCVGPMHPAKNTTKGKEPHAKSVFKINYSMIP
jgi:hypothetical protein